MLEVDIEDNSKEVLSELNKAIEKSLYAIGLLGVEGCVEKAEENDEITGHPTVDTGRYVSAFGFITPTYGAMTKPVNTDKPKKTKITDDISAQRAPKDTVIIANNVEYAPYLEYGTGTQKGGHHARYIMKRGIESKLSKMEEQTKEILEGKNVSISVDFWSE